MGIGHDAENGAVNLEPLVRHARPADMPYVARLVAEHAAYEQAPPLEPGLAQRISALLFGTPQPRLRCLVAEEFYGEVVGYATCAPEISTWEGRQYLHMDCLYLQAGHRGSGLGARLMEAVVAEARSLGIWEIQWQTPVWNDDAIGFYDHMGANGKPKLHYTLPLPD